MKPANDHVIHRGRITRRLVDLVQARPRLSWIVVPVLALVLAVGAVLGLMSDQARPGPTTTAQPASGVVRTTVRRTVAVRTPTVRTPTTRPPTLLERVTADGGALAAETLEEGATVYADPSYDADVIAQFAHVGEDEMPTTFLVLAERGDPRVDGWYRVRLPQAPNGSSGWVPATQVTPIPLTYAVEISLSAHRLFVYQQGELRAEYPVAVGKAGTETPVGEFFMVAKMQPANPAGPYGVLAIGLSAYSDTLTDWPGGGQIGIHGTNDPARIGTDASHGCVRMHNEDVEQLSILTPLGTPVVIRQ